LTDHAAIERFQALYAEHHARVYAYAVSRVGRQLADEVVSEVFLVAWRRLADVPAPALPWLLTVARNTACSQFRGSARQRSIGAELRAWVSEAELSEPDVAEAVAERICVLTALAALPEADRELLTLVAWHGLKPNEAAQVVGCSTAAYFVRLHRARRRLERAMADAPERAVAEPPERAATELPERAAADPPECAAPAPPERAVAGLPERPLAAPPERAVAGLPECAVAAPPERAVGDPAERAVADPPERAAAAPRERGAVGRAGRASAGPPDTARLGDPVLAHRKERSP
jgi:RNA polymerase sigma-70 factor, ECF subfamily